MGRNREKIPDRYRKERKRTTVKRGLKNKGHKKERQNDGDKCRKNRRKNKQYRRE